MFFGLQDVEIWRLTPVTGTWGDPEYTYHHTARNVTVQPFQSNQYLRNNQMFANVTGLIITKGTEDVVDGDELVYCKDSSYGRVQVVENWGSGVVEHKEVYTTYSQWDRQDA